MDHFFIDRMTGEELTEALFRRANRKRASFGDVLDAEVADMLGYDYLVVQDAPTYDSSTHKLVPRAREAAGAAAWTRGWEVVPLTAPELDARQQEYAVRLAQAKASRKADLNVWRVQADASYFEFAGKRIAVDDAAMRQILGTSATVALVGSFPEGWPGGWKAMDNSYVPIPDVDTWKELIREMGKQGATNFARQQQLKALVDEAVTLSEVEAITW